MGEARHWLGIVLGSLWPLIIPNWLGDAFAIFLLRQFFLTIPEEYLDAARVDGCGEFRILTTVVVRLAKPAIAAVALFSVLYTLQRLLPAAALRRREPGQLGRLDRALAVPLAPPGAVEPDDGGDAPRDAPVIVLFFLAQRAFVEGVTLTGVKG